MLFSLVKVLSPSNSNSVFGLHYHFATVTYPIFYVKFHCQSCLFALQLCNQRNDTPNFSHFQAQPHFFYKKNMCTRMPDLRLVPGH